MIWNVEGLKTVIDIAPADIWKGHDIMILTETFTIKQLDIPGFYGAHAHAKQKEAGRPSGGVSCYFKPSVGKKK